MRILFIGIDFYRYLGEIGEAFRRAGHKADVHPIESGGFFAKTLKRFGPSAYRRLLDRYHRRLFETAARCRYDRVVFLQVHHVDPVLLTRLRELQPQAKFILYNWDSLTTHDYRPWVALFDRVLTFDPVDAAREGFEYLPLFATPAFQEVDRAKVKDYDLYFVGAIGTLHRFQALAELHDFCRSNGVRLKMHLKCSPAVRLMLWRRGKSLPGLTLRSLGFPEVIDLLERSRGVYDFANHAQSGYTMRFIENMCADRKIVTENARILSEAFYQPDRFLVHAPDDFSAIPAFLDAPIESALDTRPFSIDHWARRLLGV